MYWCILAIGPGGVCHARKNRHHRSFGAFYCWRRLLPPLASIHGRLGTTKLSALRGNAIPEFIRSAFSVPGRWTSFAIKPIGPCVGTTTTASVAGSTQGPDDHHSGPAHKPIVVGISHPRRSRGRRADTM